MENTTEQLKVPKCIELKCEYCASSCCAQETYTCTYTDPYTLQPKICPLNKWVK